jgi:hypothetical protein
MLYNIDMEEIQNLKTKDISRSSHGGSRRGSGRKSKLSYEARELFNFTFDSQYQKILDKTFELALNGDKELLKFVISQRIGSPLSTVKAPQLGNVQNSQYNIIFNPEVIKATKEFDDVLKGVLYGEVKGVIK